MEEARGREKVENINNGKVYPSYAFDRYIATSNVASKPVAYYIITKKMFVSISDVNNIVNVPELESKAKYKSEQDGLLCSINDLMSAASAVEADISANRIKLLTSIIDEASSVMEFAYGTDKCARRAPEKRRICTVNRTKNA